MLNRTLGELRAELQTRLGFGMSGQAGIVNGQLMESFLRSAQEQLYWQFEWRELCEFEERLTGAEQTLYDYPDNCNVERITSVAVWNGIEWFQLTEGISLSDRSSTASGWPLKYARFDQMELWPASTTQYRMRREFVRSLLPFDASNDRTSIPSEIVFLMALANAKAHYRQADADRYEKQLDALLSRLKARNRGQSVFGREQSMSKDRFYDYPRL